MMKSPDAREIWDDRGLLHPGRVLCLLKGLPKKKMVTFI